MEIIPAIDIIDGKCVRLIQGNYSQCKIYSEDPVSMAKKFEASGLKRLHVVDLEGAKSSRVVNMRVLEQICKSTGLTVDVGGGIFGMYLTLGRLWLVLEVWRKPGSKKCWNGLICMGEKK